MLQLSALCITTHLKETHKVWHIIQVENLVEDCSHWHGDTKLVYEIGYAKSVGVHDGSGFDAGHFLHSECNLANRRGNSLIKFTVQQTQKVLTATVHHNAYYVCTPVSVSNCYY